MIELTLEEQKQFIKEFEFSEKDKEEFINSFTIKPEEIDEYNKFKDNLKR